MYISVWKELNQIAWVIECENAGSENVKGRLLMLDFLKRKGVFSVP
jgi:hypothetical protein